MRKKVPRTKKIPHHAVKFETDEERIVHENLYWER